MVAHLSNRPFILITGVDVLQGGLHKRKLMRLLDEMQY
jgi:hypothetical protein